MKSNDSHQQGAGLAVRLTTDGAHRATAPRKMHKVFGTRQNATVI